MDKYERLEKLANENLGSGRSRYIELMYFIAISTFGLLGIFFESQFLLLSALLIAVLIVVGKTFSNSMEERSKSEWVRQGILSEIGLILESLKQDKPTSIDTLVWEMMKSTGNLSYLNEIVVLRLFSMYSDVKQYNELVSKKTEIAKTDAQLENIVKILLFDTERVLDALD